MTDTVPVSVVIPAFNREEMLGRALRSVLAQRPAPAEIVVVDDASSDGTVAAAEALGARVIRHDVNRGEGAARNSGIAAATQAWIALLDSDDEWLPGHLAALWAGRGDHVLVSTSSMRCSDDPSSDRLHGSVRNRPLELRSPSDIVFPENPVPVSGVMFRRDVALAAGCYRALPHCADFDFLLRCLERGTGVVLPQVGLIYNVHPEQVSQQDDAMKAAHTEVARSYGHRPWFDSRQLARWQAAADWDVFRRHGDLAHARPLLRPWRWPALVRLWSWRFALRRRTRALNSDRPPRSLRVTAASGGEPRPLPAYSIVTPVKDEAERLALTAESLIAQDHPPAEWVVVDDGSSDGTRELAESYAQRAPWIKVVSMPTEAAGERARGGRVVRAFDHGRAQLREPHEIVVKLDGDLELPRHYFSRVTATFARDPRAGIVGGRVLVPGHDGWVPERVGSHTVHGAIKAYRVQCLEDFGGLRQSMGWDGIDEYGAKARGWKVVPLADLPVRHHARRGSKQQWWRARAEEGKGARYMGYTPSFLLARGVYRMAVESPPLLGGLALVAGWALATARDAPVVDDALAVAALRAEQRRRLRRLPFGARVTPDRV